MVRVLLASFLSAIALFMWGFVYWMIFNAVGLIMSPLPAELDVLAAMRSSQAESGVYIYPFSEGSEKESQEKFMSQFEEGPILQVAYRKEGGPTMPATQYAKGLGHNFLIALLAASLVAIAGSSLSSFGSRAGFVVLLSLFAALWAHGGDFVWWFHSPLYFAGQMVYMVVGGLLMGLIIGGIVKNSPQTGESAG